MKYTRSQKKGAGNQSYKRPFLKKKKETTNYQIFNKEDTLKVKNFVLCNLGSAVLMEIESKNQPQKEILWPAPSYVVQKTVVNDISNKYSPILKPLKEYEVGSIICSIEFKKDSNKFMCTAGGSFATVTEQNTVNKTTTIKIRGKREPRFLKLCNHLLALKGQISNFARKVKPLMKAGTASKIKKCKGQKYPTVSAMSMNVIHHPLGGKYRKNKGRRTCTSHRDSPGSKYGSISPKRTGRYK